MRGGFHALGLAAAMVAIDAGSPRGDRTTVLAAQTEEPTFRWPKSALGDGSRARHRDKPRGPSDVEKKRRRKLARQSQRRNRGRS